MSSTSLTQALHTGRDSRQVAAPACVTLSASGFYFGYWFSHRRR